MLRRWDSTLFLVAAVLYIAAALSVGLEMSSSTAVGQVADLVAPSGFAVAFVALLALTPSVGDRSSWPGRIVTLLVAIGATGMFLLAVANLVQLVGLIEDRPTWVVALNLTRFLGLAGYLLLGIVGLRAGDRERTFGAFVLAIPIVDITAFAAIGASGVEWLIVVSLLGQALLLLAIGYSLRTDRFPSSPPESSADAVG